jgi:Uma2 family endonuclease
MATAALTPLSEYLKTSYRPDREYLDGEVLERNMGKWEHARVQAALAAWFWAHESTWGVMVATEWRTQVSATRVRIPDVVVLAANSRQPDILTQPPLLIVEILSPEDTFAETQRRAEDYQRMGADTLWIIDPQTRTAKVCTRLTWTAATRLTVGGSDIYVEIADLFRAIDHPA